MRSVVTFREVFDLLFLNRLIDLLQISIKISAVIHLKGFISHYWIAVIIEKVWITVCIICYYTWEGYTLLLEIWICCLQNWGYLNLEMSIIWSVLRSKIYQSLISSTVLFFINLFIYAVYASDLKYFALKFKSDCCFHLTLIF